MGDKPEVKLGVDKDVSVLVTRGQGNNLKADFQLDSELKRRWPRVSASVPCS